MVGMEKLVDKLNGETVGVYGFGRTGKAVTRALLPVCKQISILEDGTPEAFREQQENWSDLLDWYFSPVSLSGEMDRLIVSPGVPIDHPVLRQARSQGIPVQGEVELAYQLCSGRVWAVTGTNGKSTCSELVGALLQAQGKNAVVCGNRGKPFIEAVFENNNPDFVVEISSFQVQSMEDFLSDRSLLTNLGDDHQDRHSSLEEYFSLKWELIRRTASGGRVVLPQSRREEWTERTDTREQEELFFGHHEVKGLDIHLRWTEEGLEYGKYFIPANNFPNIIRLFPENLLAAIALVQPPAQKKVISRALTHFSVPPHRAELLKTGAGVMVINDSKGTTPTSVQALIQNTPGKFSLILGGGEKSANFDDLFSCLAGRVEDLRALYLCGEKELTDRLVEQAVENEVKYQRHSNWEKAVKSLLKSAKEGETVLLSPGATSFDEFDNYRQRGRKFRRWTKEVFR